MSATVNWSLEGSPPCSLESLLAEGSISLKNLIPRPSCWRDHMSCNNQFAGLLSSPSCSSWAVAFFMSCLIMNLICVIHALKIGRRVMSVTYYDLGIDNLRSCNVWVMCDVTGAVCHGKVCDHVLCGLGKIILSYFYGGCIYPSVVIYSCLCLNCNDLSCDVFSSGTVICIGSIFLNFSSGASSLIWHGDLWVPCNVSLEFWKEVFCVGSPWQYDCIHCIHST